MKILLVRLDHMGDIALTVPPVAKLLRDKISSATLTVLTTSAGEQIIRDDPHIDKIMVFDPPWSVPEAGQRYTPKWQYFSRCMYFLRARNWRASTKFDVILYLSFSPWERFLTFLKSKQRIGFSGPYHRLIFRLSCYLLTTKIPFQRHSHILDNCFNLLASVCAARQSDMDNSSLQISTMRQHFGRQLIQKAVGDYQRLVIVHAGSSLSMKSWPFINFLAVARKIEVEFKINCILIGAPWEIVSYQQQCKLAGVDLPNTLETNTINELISVIANATLFLSNDGGPMHIASMLGVPTVAVFGPTDERVYGPRGAQAKVAREPNICGQKQYPWQINGCCKKTDKVCLRMIRVETVLDIVAKLIKITENKKNGLLLNDS